MSIEGMDGLNARLTAISDHRQLLGTIGLLAVSYAKDVVPRKTGNLGRTIRLGQVTDKSAQILAGGTNGVGYAQAVEFGTGPHTIVPVRRKVLAWGGNRRLSGSLRSGASAKVFARRVNHPGSKAKPYLVPSAKKAVEDSGLSVIVKAWNDAD